MSEVVKELLLKSLEQEKGGVLIYRAALQCAVMETKHVKTATEAVHAAKSAKAS